MGQPGWSNVQSFPYESIVRVKETRGTETSKYPEEEKITMIAQVVASERALAQTGAVPVAAPGVVGPSARAGAKRSGSPVETGAAEGDSPVRETRGTAQDGT